MQLAGLAGMVAARTSPSLAVTVVPVALADVNVACITVPKAHGEVATTGGVYLRRRMSADGQPECVAMLPHDRASRIVIELLAGGISVEGLPDWKMTNDSLSRYGSSME